MRGEGLAGTGHQAKGFAAPLLWPGVLSRWSQQCPHLVAPLQRMSEGRKPQLEPQGPGGALPGRSPAWCLRCHREPCSQIRTGFLM